MSESGKHDAGCIYGGFSCGYWLVVEGCPEPHPEIHYVVDGDRCPCGITFAGAGSDSGPVVVKCDAAQAEGGDT